MIDVSTEMLMGVALGIVIPLLIWGLRMYYMVRTTLEMHRKPDTHGFGNGNTNRLLAKMMAEQEAIHKENMSSAKTTRYTIRELSHYVRWDAQNRTGKKPPPYVRNGN